MVAKIKTGKNLKGALYYNEHKVGLGKAELLEAVSYAKDAPDLSFQDKLRRLTNLSERNMRTKTNTVHISLNFPKGETLSDHLMKQIAGDYMQGIGFGSQPYLIYRHYDAGHPHLHVVTTNITRDGSRISLHNIGRNESEATRKYIETKYELMKAEDQAIQRPELQIPAIAEYGKQETKRMITNIVGYVLRHYKVTSVPELNAVLQGFRITADRGDKDSRIQRNGGLMYWVLNANGQKAGVPIKASSLYGKPTLQTLTGKFQLNETLRKKFKMALIQKIGQVMHGSSTLDEFQKGLAKADIELLLRKNEEGRLYGVTFIDHVGKVVFNGSDLGKIYSANLLSARFADSSKANIDHRVNEPSAVRSFDDSDRQGQEPSAGLTELLLQQERDDQGVPYPLKKRKRKKGLNL